MCSDSDISGAARATY
uniref:Uncharacterized protein n=1 Tax=Timema shepardi TaxID=629360 RepID=A0A7R9BA26_TIMSH|nr:unnamed protein product [Timema shepardi]